MCICLEMQTPDISSKTSAEDMEQQQQQQRDDDAAKEDAEKTVSDDNGDGDYDESSAVDASQPPELIIAPRDTGHDRDQMLTR